MVDCTTYGNSSYWQNQPNEVTVPDDGNGNGDGDWLVCYVNEVINKRGDTENYVITLNHTATYTISESIIVEKGNVTIQSDSDTARAKLLLNGPSAIYITFQTTNTSRQAILRNLEVEVDAKQDNSTLTFLVGNDVSVINCHFLATAGYGSGGAIRCFTNGTERIFIEDSYFSGWVGKGSNLGAVLTVGSFNASDPSKVSAEIYISNSLIENVNVGGSRSSPNTMYLVSRNTTISNTQFINTKNNTFDSFPTSVITLKVSSDGSVDITDALFRDNTIGTQAGSAILRFDTFPGETPQGFYTNGCSFESNTGGAAGGGNPPPPFVGGSNLPIVGSGNYYGTGGFPTGSYPNGTLPQNIVVNFTLLAPPDPVAVIKYNITDTVVSDERFVEFCGECPSGLLSLTQPFFWEFLTLTADTTSNDQSPTRFFPIYDVNDDPITHRVRLTVYGPDYPGDQDNKDSAEVTFNLAGIAEDSDCFGTGDCGAGVHATEGDSAFPDPVAAQTLMKREQMADIQVAIPMGQLTFTRTFQQDRLDDAFYNDLGRGWTHNHRMLIDLAAPAHPDKGNQIILHSGASEVPFFQDQTNNNLWESGVGATSTIVQSGTTYTLTRQDGAEYVFEAVDPNADMMNEVARVEQHTDTRGQVLTYHYTAAQSTKLDYVEDGYKHRLTFTYFTPATPDFIESVDYENHNMGSPTALLSVGFTYEDDVAMTGKLLETVNDVRGKVWRYLYHDTTNVYYTDWLKAVLPPPSVQGEDGYSVASKWITYLPDDNTELASIRQELGVQYDENSGVYTKQGAAPRQTLTTWSENENTADIQETTYYPEENSDRGKWSQRFVEGHRIQTLPNGREMRDWRRHNQRPFIQEDPRGNSTHMTWDSDGTRLNSVMDALEQETSFTYDSEQRLTHVLHADGTKTRYVYPLSGTTDYDMSPREPRLIERLDQNDVVQDKQEINRTYDSDINGDYLRQVVQKTVDLDNPSESLRETVTTYFTPVNPPDTTNGYHGVGQVASVQQVDTKNQGNDETVSYYYDRQNRLIKTHKESIYGTCEYSYTVYDEAGNVLATSCTRKNLNLDADPTVASATLLAEYNMATDAATLTTYQYDDWGRQTHVRSYYDDNTYRESRMIYDALSRVVRQVSNYKGTSDPSAWVWNGTYWQAGVTDNTKVSDDTGGENIISITDYDRQSRVQRTQDVFGESTLYGYDSSGRLVRTVQNPSAPDYFTTYTDDPELDQYTQRVTLSNAADQDIITSQKYDVNGNLIESTNAVGTRTLSTYDALNRPHKQLVSANPAARADLESDDIGYSVYTDPATSQFVSSTAAAYDHLSQTEYDKLGRVIRTKRLLENRSSGGEEWEVTLYGYDSQGRQVRVIRYASSPDYDIAADPTLVNYSISTASEHDVVTDTVYKPSGEVRYTIDVDGVKNWTVYDGLGRVFRSVAAASVDPGTTAEVSAIESLTGLSYTGANLAAQQDPASDIVAETYYDSDGRVQRTARVLSYDTDNQTTEWVWTLYGYDDPQGRQVATVQNASVPDYFDDTNGYADPELKDYETNITPSIDTDKDIISRTEYDDRGRVVKMIAVNTETNGQDRVTLYGYDENDRRVRTITNASNPNYDRSTDPSLANYTGSSLDPDQDRISVTAYGFGGRVVSTTNSAGRITRYVYDRLGRRVRTIQNYTNPTGNDDPETWMWNDGWKDNVGNPITHGNNNDDDLVTETVYDKAGRVIQTRDPRGTLTEFGYDAAGRRTSVTYAKGTDIETTDYTCYDKAGRVRRVITNWNGTGDPDAVNSNGAWAFAPTVHGDNNDQNLITTYEYDNANRRIRVTDPEGNVTETTYAKDGVVLTTTQVGAHDDDGTPTDVVSAYRYDALNRRTMVVANRVTTGDLADWSWNSGLNQWEDNN